MARHVGQQLSSSEWNQYQQAITSALMQIGNNNTNNNSNNTTTNISNDLASNLTPLSLALLILLTSNEQPIDHHQQHLPPPPQPPPPPLQLQQQRQNHLHSPINFQNFSPNNYQNHRSPPDNFQNHYQNQFLNHHTQTHPQNYSQSHSPNQLLATTSYKSQPPPVPSSTLLAKLNSVTSRPNAHLVATKLDQRMIDLLEAFYAINDNPEPAAIEMIAKRINTTVDAIGNWFDSKRLELHPQAGPRSPPAKKRAGGRVVTFSEYQRSLLEAIFDENNYLHPQEYEELSNLIQVPSRNIKIWFKNRRSKQRLSGRITTPGSVNNSD